MPGISAKHLGTWKPVKAVWARVAAAWLPVKMVSARTALGWKPVMSSVRAYISGNMIPTKVGGSASTTYNDRGNFSVVSSPTGATISGHQWSITDDGGLLSMSSTTSAICSLTGPSYDLMEEQLYWSFTLRCSAIVNGVRQDVETYSSTYTTRGGI